MLGDRAGATAGTGEAAATRADAAALARGGLGGWYAPSPSASGAVPGPGKGASAAAGGGGCSDAAATDADGTLFTTGAASVAHRGV